MIPCWYEAYKKNPKPPNFFFSQIYPVDFCPAKFPSCSKPATISSACCLLWVFINAFTPGQTGCEMNCDQENSIVYSLRHFEIQRMTAIPVVQDHVLGLLTFFFFKYQNDIAVRWGNIFLPLPSHFEFQMPSPTFTAAVYHIYNT